jgi:hypothetical protein
LLSPHDPLLEYGIYPSTPFAYHYFTSSPPYFRLCL